MLRAQCARFIPTGISAISQRVIRRPYRAPPNRSLVASAPRIRCGDKKNSSHRRPQRLWIVMARGYTFEPITKSKEAAIPIARSPEERSRANGNGEHDAHSGSESPPSHGGIGGSNRRRRPRRNPYAGT